MKRLRDYALTGLLFAGFAVAISYLESLSVEELTGTARVIDGDSLEIGLSRTRIRLEGVDAPEIGQICSSDNQRFDCGRRARQELAGIISGNTVTCQSSRQDRYGRRLATCIVDGVNIGREMVARGWAVSYGSYLSQERSARRLQVGLWRGDFELPRDWRETSKGSMVGGGNGALQKSRLQQWASEWWRGPPDN